MVNIKEKLLVLVDARRINGCAAHRKPPEQFFCSLFKGNQDRCELFNPSSLFLSCPLSPSPSHVLRIHREYLVHSFHCRSSKRACNTDGSAPSRGLSIARLGTLGLETTKGSHCTSNNGIELF